MYSPFLLLYHDVFLNQVVKTNLNRLLLNVNVPMLSQVLSRADRHHDQGICRAKENHSCDEICGKAIIRLHIL
jgi:hypothetical protein